jgi:class 3 adenylate cyclase
VDCEGKGSNDGAATMTHAVFTPAKPMAKDSSCMNIVTCRHYLNRVLPHVPDALLFNTILGNGAFAYLHEDTGKIVPVTREYLLDYKNWVSNALLNRVYQNVVSILKDPEAVYKAGRNISHSAVGAQIFLMRLAGVQTIISRLAKENAKFNRNRTIEIIENRNGYAIVRIHWQSDPAITKYFCGMNRGVYEGLGILTKNPAIVEETKCQFDGGEHCEYHIKWKAKPFYSRLMDIFRFRLSREMVDELERKIEEVNMIRWRQEQVIELRTRDLEKQKQKVENAHNFLCRYVPPQLARKILEGDTGPVWDHRRKKLTMLFSDIKEFTQTTDAMEPEDLAKLLNEYFSCMNAIIQRYEGTLANITGDALFVFFGAPDETDDADHALRCVRMAIAMQRKMAELQKKWFEEGIEYPLQIRCGINTGMATVGSFGSNERSEYTAMGMQVNLASRLETTCAPGGILISHSTWALVKDAIDCMPKTPIHVKGLARPFRVYEVNFTQ